MPGAGARINSAFSSNQKKEKGKKKKKEKEKKRIRNSLQKGLVAESQLETLAWGYVQVHGLRVVVVKMPITNDGDDAFLPRYRFRTRAFTLRADWVAPGIYHDLSALRPQLLPVTKPPSPRE